MGRNTHEGHSLSHSRRWETVLLLPQTFRNLLAEDTHSTGVSCTAHLALKEHPVTGLSTLGLRVTSKPQAPLHVIKICPPPPVGVPKNRLLVLNVVPEECKTRWFWHWGPPPCIKCPDLLGGPLRGTPTRGARVPVQLQTTPITPCSPRLTLSAGLRTTGFWRKHPPECSRY